jgi:hypothetical protein
MRAAGYCAVLLALTIARGNVARGEETWTDVRRAGPFVCHANFKLDGLSELLSEIAQLEDDVVTTLNLEPTAAEYDLYLFDSKSAFRKYLVEHFPEAPSRRALYIQNNGRGQVFAYQQKELADDLRHECTHALLHSSVPEVPLWLDEGLAEYFEAPAEQRVFEHPQLAAARKWNQMLWGIAPLDKLERMHQLDAMGWREYRDSCLWVHFMLHGPEEAQEVMSEYLSDLRTGRTQPQLSRRLIDRLPSAPERMGEHVKSWRRPGAE